MLVLANSQLYHLIGSPRTASMYNVIGGYRPASGLQHAALKPGWWLAAAAPHSDDWKGLLGLSAAAWQTPAATSLAASYCRVRRMHDQ